MDDIDDLFLDDYEINDEISQAIKSNEPVKEKESTDQSKKTIKKLRLDPELLLETKGLPLLRNETRHLKFKGKGHEDEDLRKLMDYYTVWANNLYPKFTFKDFAEKIGKPASSKRVKVVIEEWQKEYIERRNIRLNIAKELSGKTSDSEDQEEQQNIEEDESSEDDNRPLFIPLTNSTPTAPKPKTAKKSKEKAKGTSPKSTQKKSQDQESEDEEESLFSRGSKRKVTFDDDDEEDNSYSMTRENALSLIAKKRAEKAAAAAAAASKTLDKTRNTESNSIVNEHGDLDNEGSEPNIPTKDHQKDIHTEKEDEEMAFSDNELIEDLDKPNYMDVNEQFSDNEMIDDLDLMDTTTSGEKTEKLTEF